jgi:hypothetical protein
LSTLDLGVTVVGYRRKGGRWVGLDELQVIAKQRKSLRDIDQYDLRIYGPPDYHDRLRRYLEEQGQMRIPKLTEASEATDEGSGSGAVSSLRVRMHRLGVTQAKLAEQLGCAQQFVTQVLGGDRPWPDGMRERAEEYLKGIEDSRAQQSGG